MTSHRPDRVALLAPQRRPFVYWLLWFPFALVFAGSVVLNIVDPVGGEVDYVALGFPAWLVWWASLAKALGLIAIAWGRSRTLTVVAYAGFVYDLLLAITAHLYTFPLHVDRLVLAVFTLGFTGLALWAERRYTWRAAPPASVDSANESAGTSFARAANPS